MKTPRGDLVSVEEELKRAETELSETVLHVAPRLTGVIRRLIAVARNQQTEIARLNSLMKDDGR